jgi:hypothetical protein
MLHTPQIVWVAELILAEFCQHAGRTAIARVAKLGSSYLSYVQERGFWTETNGRLTISIFFLYIFLQTSPR